MVAPPRWGLPPPQFSRLESSFLIVKSQVTHTIDHRVFTLLGSTLVQPTGPRHRPCRLNPILDMAPESNHNMITGSWIHISTNSSTIDYSSCFSCFALHPVAITSRIRSDNHPPCPRRRVLHTPHSINATHTYSQTAPETTTRGSVTTSSQWSSSSFCGQRVCHLLPRQIQTRQSPGSTSYRHSLKPLPHITIPIPASTVADYQQPILSTSTTTNTTTNTNIDTNTSPSPSPKTNKKVMKVSYQGVPGAYSEGATIQHFGLDSERLPCSTFEQAYQALMCHEVDRAVLPIENSVAGTIHKNLDLLLKYTSLQIVNEIDFRVRHCVMVYEDKDDSDTHCEEEMRLDSGATVLSHPMALAQCQKYIAKYQLEPREFEDTAGAAKHIAENKLKGVGAIASSTAAERYGLKIIHAGVEDYQNNYTRFLVLARMSSGTPDSSSSTAKATSTTEISGSPGGALRPVTPRAMPSNQGNMKTSIVFTLRNVPGSLARALSIFASVDIDMTRIESRHLRSFHDACFDDNSMGLWEYIFFVDLVADVKDAHVKKALNLLEEICPYYRLLGCYPRDNHENETTSA